MTAAVRRRFLTEPGEPLLLCQSATALIQRFGELADQSGIGDDKIISNALSAVPLPDYGVLGNDPRTWAGLAPGFMWHPFVWLPKSLTRRRVVQTDDGRELTEVNEVWTLRMIVELAASSLYDVETGTWLDVLSVIGLDIEDEDVQERLAAWLDGAEDEELEAIDLNLLLEDDTDEPDWSFDLAVDLTMPTLYASWAVMANELSTMLDLVPEAEDDEDILSILGTVAFTGTDTLAAVPDAEGKTSHSYWATIREAVNAADVDALLSSETPQLSEYLAEVRDAYWPHYEALPLLVARYGDMPEDNSDDDDLGGDSDAVKTSDPRSSGPTF